MKSLKSIYERLEECNTMKQLAEVPEIIEVTSLVSTEEAMRMNMDFQKNCELLDAEDCQSLSVMKNITAGGPVLQKTLKR